MSLEANKDLIRTYVETIFNQRQVDRAEELVTPGGCPDRRGSSVAVPVLIRRRHPPCSV